MTIRHDQWFFEERDGKDRVVHRRGRDGFITEERIERYVVTERDNETVVLDQWEDKVVQEVSKRNAGTVREEWIEWQHGSHPQQGWEKISRVPVGHYLKNPGLMHRVDTITTH